MTTVSYLVKQLQRKAQKGTCVDLWFQFENMPVMLHSTLHMETGNGKRWQKKTKQNKTEIAKNNEKNTEIS